MLKDFIEKIKTKYLKRSVIVLLLLWLITVFTLTVFIRQPFEGQHFQGELFWSYTYGISNIGTRFVVQMIENVIMYIPFGFLFPFLLKGKCPDIAALGICILVGAAVSFSTESLQYFCKLGLFEFDDVIHNALGTIIGFVLHKACIKW